MKKIGFMVSLFTLFFVISTYLFAVEPNQYKVTLSLGGEERYAKAAFTNKKIDSSPISSSLIVSSKEININPIVKNNRLVGEIGEEIYISYQIFTNQKVSVGVKANPFEAGIDKINYTITFISQDTGREIKRLNVEKNESRIDLYTQEAVDAIISTFNSWLLSVDLSDSYDGFADNNKTGYKSDITLVLEVS